MKEKFNLGYILRISIVAALGGLLFGYDIAIISGTVPFIEDFFKLDATAIGWAVASAYIGCIVGVTVAGKLTDRYGRKKILIISAIIFVISAMGTGLSNSLFFFVFYRILGGIAVGMASILSPMYIAEISPAKYRGRFVSLNQLTIVLGLQFAYFASYLLVDINEDNWRWMFISEALPAVLFFVFMFFVPESPRWLAKKNYNDKSFEILNKLGGDKFARLELSQIQESFKNTRIAKWKELLRPEIRLIMITGIFLAIFQQWSGINVIFFYAPMIFEKTGLAVDAAIAQTVIIGSVNLIFTFVAIWLVDRIGRKILLLSGSIGMAVCHILIGWAFYTDQLDGFYLLIIMLICAASFAATLGPVVWVVLSEIFPNRIRGMAMGVATLCLWAACFTLTMTFPVLLKALEGAFTFWIYAGVCLIGFIYILKFVPETKGKSLEQIEKQLIKLKNNK
ncbi:sugar porter family MFS transporter [Bacteroidota bacterium]